jgi:ribosome biogenesis GTPase
MPIPATASATGIVTQHDGPSFFVELGAGEVVCRLRGRLRKHPQRATSPVVVGDRVTVELLSDGTGAIESVQPRRSELVRPGFAGVDHVIAANLDQVLIVQAARQPPFKRRLVERFVAAARRGRMAAALIVNKCDLEVEATLRERVAPLADSGLRVVLTSATEGRGLEEARALLIGKLSVLAGQSGVGKSSLLNALYPDFAARTSAVSEKVNKGRHTTTSSRLYRLPGGGYLADTPGIRSLGLYDDDEAVAGAFPEILAAAAGCRFRDCTHAHERDCAVQAGVGRGEIHPDRYRNYLRLARGG